jgi:glycine cleavage system pyridoxal-binding protein P
MRKVPKSQQKLYSIMVRCNPEEAALVKKYAAEENLDMSKFMRKLLSERAKNGPDSVHGVINDLAEKHGVIIEKMEDVSQKIESRI